MPNEDNKKGQVKSGLEIWEHPLETLSRTIAEQNPHFTQLEVKVEAFKIFYKDDFPPAQLEEIAQKLKEWG